MVTGDKPFDPEKDAPLLSAYVDDELEAADVARVEAYLASSVRARDEVEGLRRLRELTAGLRLKEAPPEAWEVFWNSIYNRAERSLGWILLSIGLVMIGGFACYQLVTALVATEVLPWWMKAAIFTVCIGVLVLLISIVRERVYVRKRTRYKDIVR